VPSLFIKQFFFEDTFHNNLYLLVRSYPGSERGDLHINRRRVGLTTWQLSPGHDADKDISLNQRTSRIRGAKAGAAGERTRAQIRGMDILALGAQCRRTRVKTDDGNVLHLLKGLGIRGAVSFAGAAPTEEVSRASGPHSGGG